MRSMMAFVCLAALLTLTASAQQPAPPPPPPPPAGAPPVGAPPVTPDPNAPPAVRYDEGPLKAEVIAQREIRMNFSDSAERTESESNYAMLVRVRGERLKDIVRYGNVIMTEVVDDAGKALLDPNGYTEEEKTQMRPQNMPPQRLTEMGLQAATRAMKTASRDAKALKTARGTVKLVLADSSEKATILNPLQYAGKMVEHPRLAELGIEVRVVPGDELESPPPGQAIILQYQTKADNIKSAQFFDGSMKQLRSRERPVTTKAGDKATLFMIDGAGFNEEMQLVLEVHPKVEEIELPINADGLKLP